MQHRQTPEYGEKNELTPEFVHVTDGCVCTSLEYLPIEYLTVNYFRIMIMSALEVNSMLSMLISRKHGVRFYE